VEECEEKSIENMDSNGKTLTFSLLTQNQIRDQIMNLLFEKHETLF